jgi:hypothetical protein
MIDFLYTLFKWQFSLKWEINELCLKTNVCGFTPLNILIILRKGWEFFIDRIVFVEMGNINKIHKLKNILIDMKIRVVTDIVCL